MLYSHSLAFLASVLPLLASAAPTFDSPLNERAAPKPKPIKFHYDTQKVYGVNLGGWFVLEPWIKPSIFSDFATNQLAVDEWTYCQQLGPVEASTRLQQHWKTWYTQQDFQDIAAAGLNHVRIPIGYWSIVPRQGDPFVQGAYAYLKKAVTWAQAAGLKVMIDLHGAPGSQNGFDNSGHYGNVTWGSGADDISLTLQSIQKLKKDFATKAAVVSIELVNEPKAGQIGTDIVKDYYTRGDQILKKTGLGVIIQDGFLGPKYWNDYGAGLYNLVVDTHHYQVFSSNILKYNNTRHVQAACAQANSVTGNTHPTFCGEWCGAMTDCAYWLNGLGKGARYDGTLEGSTYIGSCDGLRQGTVAALPAQTKTNMRRYIEAQLDAYEKGAGWIFWTWKTEGAPEWDMRDLINNGVFPQPLSQRQYPGQCPT